MHQEEQEECIIYHGYNGGFLENRGAKGKYEFGKGSNGVSTFGNSHGTGGSGGSGGYFGGTGGDWSYGIREFEAHGASGSSYISGYPRVKSVTSQTNSALTNKITHYSGMKFTNGSMMTSNYIGDGKIVVVKY